VASVPTRLPRSSVDAQGRALPMTEADVRARAEAIARGLKSLDDMGDDEEQRQTFDALVEAIDADRLADRKRFR
jgi:hypothetical protein